jgi:hypothetical protein
VSDKAYTVIGTNVVIDCGTVEEAIAYERELWANQPATPAPLDECPVCRWQAPDHDSECHAAPLIPAVVVCHDCLDTMNAAHPNGWNEPHITSPASQPVVVERNVGREKDQMEAAFAAGVRSASGGCELHDTVQECCAALRAAVKGADR